MGSYFGRTLTIAMSVIASSLLMPKMTLAQPGLEEFSSEITIAQGLGPNFNARSCKSCHGYPTPGGDEGFCESCVVTRFGAKRADGEFDHLQALGGPVLQRYSVSLNSGHFGYLEEQLPSSKDIPQSEVVSASRRPPYLFGVGLIERIPDKDILEFASKHKEWGGIANIIIDPKSKEIRVGRFGWKAQFVDLKSTTSQALLEEHGVEPSEQGSQREAALLAFQRSLKPPMHRISNHQGELIFNQIGCGNCHVKKLSDAQDFFPYSDFLLHNMGKEADGLEENGAQASEMRTAPLWGVMLRFPQGAEHPGTLYHDRKHVANMERGVLAHATSDKNQAYDSIKKFEELSKTEREGVIKFLATLGSS